MKSLQAEMAELRKQMTKMASLGQVADTSAPVRRPSSSAMDAYMYGAAGEVVGAAATRAQTTAQAAPPPSTLADVASRPRHTGLPDHIGQARLPLSFTIADAVASGTAPPPVSASRSSRVQEDAAHTLAYKVLQLPVFSGVDLSIPEFQPSSVFHLAGSMLEGKVPMPSLEVAQAVVLPPSEEELVAMRAKLAAEAIAEFEANASSSPLVQSSEDHSLISGVAYLADIAA